MILVLSPSEARKVQKILRSAADPELVAVCERLDILVKLDVLNGRLAILARQKP